MEAGERQTRNGALQAALFLVLVLESSWRIEDEDEDENDVPRRPGGRRSLFDLRNARRHL
jgi:hypothetical protein